MARTAKPRARIGGEAVGAAMWNWRMTMKPSPEPRFAKIAAMIADPTRARMLTHLLGSEHATAGELARAAGITPQTASAHLVKLVDSGLVTIRPQGRHRY